MSFIHVTDPVKIEAYLDGFVKSPDGRFRGCSFIPGIRLRAGAVCWGKPQQGGVIFEGHRPFAKVTLTPDDTTRVVRYDLTHSDSNYTQLVVTIKLDDIQELQI